MAAGRSTAKVLEQPSGARTTVTLGLCLLLAGALFDSPSLYVAAVGLLAVAGFAVGWVGLAAGGARIERLPGPPTVVEGEPYPLRIRLRRGFLPPHGELVDPLLPAPLPIAYGWSRGQGFARVGRREVILGGEVRFAHRGHRGLEPPRMDLRDPLGVRLRRLAGDGDSEVLVLPRTEPVIAAGDPAGEEGDPFAGLGAGAGAGLQATLDVEVDGLRPYREGAPASRIHWPAVARHGELIERRLVSGGQGLALVVLDSEHPQSEEALDAAVRAAASLCLHLASSGGCSLILAGEQRPLRVDAQLRNWPLAHARLALVQSGVALAARPLRSGGAGFWVTAGGPRAPSRAIAGADVAAWFLVSPAVTAGTAPAFTVAGCEGRLLRASRAGAARIARSAA